MGKFVISERKDGQLIFYFKGNNGQVILTSEGYSSKFGVENGIKLVKANVRNDSSYIQFRNSIKGDYSFRIIAPNGMIIGHSGQFTNIEDRDKALNELKRTAAEAIIEKEPIRLQ